MLRPPGTLVCQAQSQAPGAQVGADTHPLSGAEAGDCLLSRIPVLLHLAPGVCWACPLPLGTSLIPKCVQTFSPPLLPW